MVTPTSVAVGDVFECDDAESEHGPTDDEGPHTETPDGLHTVAKHSGVRHNLIDVDQVIDHSGAHMQPGRLTRSTRKAAGFEPLVASLRA